MDNVFETVKKSYNSLYKSQAQLQKGLNKLMEVLEEIASKTDSNLNDDAKMACNMCKNLAVAHLDSSESFMYYAAKLYGRLFVYKMKNFDTLNSKQNHTRFQRDIISRYNTFFQKHTFFSFNPKNQLT
jgi:hypothetical protein